MRRPSPNNALFSILVAVLIAMLAIVAAGALTSPSATEAMGLVVLVVLGLAAVHKIERDAGRRWIGLGCLPPYSAEAARRRR